MFYQPFWLFLAVSVLLAVGTIWFRKLHFTDIQLIIMLIAVTMSFDMLLCKQYHLYNYVNQAYKGWYSFWANSVIIPSLGLVYIKFIPAKRAMIILYTICWSAVLTLFELYVAKPLGIVHYPVWRIFPWSTIGYLMAFTAEYFYYRKILSYPSSRQK